MEDNKYIFPTMLDSKFILRSTGEEVEVIASNLVESGERNENDWVSYIDSNGKEHIKESLNILFDFKVSNEMSKMFTKIFDTPKYDFPKYDFPKLPSTENTRMFELIKELVVHKDYSVTEAVKLSKEIVELCTEI